MQTQPRSAHEILTTNQEFFLAAQSLCQIEQPRKSRQRRDSRRRDVRERRSISISIRPLDCNLEPDGDVFWVVSQDISVRGIGMLSHEPFEHEFVLIGLLDSDIQVIGQVRHNTSIGSAYPLYLVGAEFLEQPLR